MRVATPDGLEPLKRLTKDIRDGGGTMGRDEARFLVDLYYMMQEDRKRGSNQVRSLVEGEEPNATLAFFASQFATLENQVRSALDAYSAGNVLGQWARSIVGIGPVISAGLLAHIDLEKAPTVAHIWRFAGLDPTVRWDSKDKVAKWVKGRDEELPLVVALATNEFGRNYDTLMRFAQRDKEGNEVKLTKDRVAASISRRPWNASLKTLCWKIGESFVKVSGNDEDIYGKLYLQRKATEITANEAGRFAELAAHILATKNIGKSTEAYKAYSIGKLPPGHIHARAKRWAVKLFLSHYHERGYELLLNKKAPAPYSLTMLKHAHYIGPRK